VTAVSAGPGLVLGSVLVGIAVGERIGPHPAGGLMIVTALAAGVAVWLRGRVGLALACVAACCLGGAMMCRALDGQAHSPITGIVDAREGATVDVVLGADPSATRFSAQALARVTRVRLEGGDRVQSGGRTVLVSASGDAAARLGVLQAGDRVRLSGYFRPLDGFETRWRWRHAVGAFAAHEVLAIREPDQLLLRIANALRGRVLAGHHALPEPQRALVAGFLLGDTADLPGPVVAEFRAAGLSHLLAVSGQNVAFVLALAGPLIRVGPGRVRLAGGLAVLTVFAAMTRWEPSVLRASAMAACSMVALTAGRPTTGLRALALGATALLLVDPFLVHSVGFVLSCAASGGIAAFGPAITARVRGPRWCAEGIGVTLGAQIAVAPVLVAVFEGVPLVAVPANLAAAPFAGPLTAFGLVGGVVGGLLPVGAARAVVSFPAYVFASVVLVIARVAAATPLTLRASELILAGLGVATAFAARGIGRATWRRARPDRADPEVALPPR
jgi:competence protein ComEC